MFCYDILCYVVFSVWPLLHSLSIPIFTYCVFLTIYFYYYFMLYFFFILNTLTAWVFLHKISNSPFHLLLSFLANAHAGFLIAVLNVKDAFFTTAVFIAQMSAKRMSTERIALASLVCLPLHPPSFLSSASCVWGGCPVSGCCKAILFTPGWKPLLWKLAD